MASFRQTELWPLWALPEAQILVVLGLGVTLMAIVLSALGT